MGLVLQSQRKCFYFFLKTPEVEFDSFFCVSFVHSCRSAYHHYSKYASPIIKEELLKEGKDTSLGVVVSVVSARVSCLILGTLILSRAGSI